MGLGPIRTIGPAEARERARRHRQERLEDRGKTLFNTEPGERHPAERPGLKVRLMARRGTRAGLALESLGPERQAGRAAWGDTAGFVAGAANRTFIVSNDGVPISTPAAARAKSRAYAMLGTGTGQRPRRTIRG